MVWRYYGIPCQRQPSRGVPRKRCSENMLQICRRTPMPKCDLNKVAKQLDGCFCPCFHFFFFFFYLEPTVRKYNLDQNDFCHWYGNFLKVLSWKLLDRSYVGSFLSTITRHIGNSILKDTLQSKILPTWISILVNSFIKNWEDIWKENRSCLKSYTLHTNASLHFEQHCTKIDHILLIFTRFFSLKQT